jgi:hypothetical protein
MNMKTNQRAGMQERPVTIKHFSMTDCSDKRGNEWESFIVGFIYDDSKNEREITHKRPTWSTTGRLLVDKGPLEPGSRYLVTIEKENEYQVWTDIQPIGGVA